MAPRPMPAAPAIPSIDRGRVQRAGSRVTDAATVSTTVSETQSLVRHLDSNEPGVDVGDFKVLAGQVGVLIGIGGQPYVLEVFDTPFALRRQFRARLSMYMNAISAICGP